MATSKPLSTVSYNTESFLHEKLEELQEKHLIRFYMYIKHIGEEYIDLNGEHKRDKDHFHVYFKPNKPLDVMDLRAVFDEPDFYNPKPLRCRPIQESKEEDWLLYVVHDPTYLKLKYIDDPQEKLPYSWENIVSSDYFDVEIAFGRARSYLMHNSANIASRLQEGANGLDMVKAGENPVLVNSIMRIQYNTQYEKLHRELEALKLEHFGLIEFMKDNFDLTDIFYDVNKKQWEFIKEHI